MTQALLSWTASVVRVKPLMPTSSLKFFAPLSYLKNLSSIRSSKTSGMLDGPCSLHTVPEMSGVPPSWQ